MLFEPIRGRLTMDVDEAVPLRRACRFDSLAERDTIGREGARSWDVDREARALHSSVGMQPLIALAEDNPELRALLASALELVGYRVVQVGTGEQLIATVRRLLDAREPLRLIITDVRMPALGGLDAARLLQHAGHTIPLIFMTAYGDAWTRTQATELGATLLDKPLSLNVLREVVKRAIGS